MLKNNTTKLKASVRLMGLVVMVAILGGCTMAPTYIRPDAPIPNVYSSDAGNGDPSLMPWRTFFKDEGIQRVVGLALEHNRDLRIALLNVEKARALYRIQAADLLPTISAASSIDSQKLPAMMSPTLERDITRTYSASLGFSAFELDLFGRVRSLTEAAHEQYYSIDNDAQSARLTLVAEVAGMYLQLVADRELRDITEKTYKNRKSHYDSTLMRHKSGIASLLEVSQARTGMEEARSSFAQLEAKLGQTENTLALLMGTSIPQDLPNVRKLTMVKALPDVPAGLPSQLLERRPDLVSAEHMLKSYNANIGAARANFFPTISLTAALGTISPDARHLFGNGMETWRFMPQATLPIFDTGRNIATLQAAKRDKDIAVARYEKTIQTAFKEVSDGLVQREFIGEQLDAQRELLNATSQYYSLAKNRYDVGVDNQLTMLDAQRSLYSAEVSYINTRLLRETNALTLYKTLGGGWE